MTKVARLFELEKEEAVKEAKRENTFEIAKKLLNTLPIDEIANLTGLTIEEESKLKKD